MTTAFLAFHHDVINKIGVAHVLSTIILVS